MINITAIFHLLTSGFLLIPLPLEVELPVPTGAYATGTTSYHLVDKTRGSGKNGSIGRELGVQFWFPTENPYQSAQRAPYISQWQLVETLIAHDYFEQDHKLISKWMQLETHSLNNSPPCKGNGRLVVFSPGLGVIRANYTLIAEELASHGYTVAVIDHPFGAIMLTPGGKIIQSTDDGEFRDDETTFAQYESDWGQDMLFVADWAMSEKSPLQGRVQLTQAVACGHSLGGAAAFEACRLSERFKAGVNMDGLSFGLSTTEGVGAPCLLVKAIPEYSDDDLAARGRTREQWDAMAKEVRPGLLAPLTKNTNGPAYYIEIRRLGHMSFSDSPFVMPNTISRFGGKQMEANLANQIVTGILQAFFEEVLSKQPRLLEDSITDQAGVTIESINR